MESMTSLKTVYDVGAYFVGGRDVFLPLFGGLPC